MQTNIKQRSTRIICEVHPQFLGSMSELKRMIIQSKMGGADIVKVQLYDSEKLFQNNDRSYLDINFKELSEIDKFSKDHGIELSASIFNEDRLDWCEKLNFKTYKIASRTVTENQKLCEKIISTGKETIISLGMYDYEMNGKPFDYKNIKYLYCVSEYPTMLEKIKMPDFENSFFDGYSDHTINISACVYAISRGANIIEKHYSNSNNLNIATQQAHVCSMNFEQLNQLRFFADSLSLLKTND